MTQTKEHQWPGFAVVDDLDDLPWSTPSKDAGEHARRIRVLVRAWREDRGKVDRILSACAASALKHLAPDGMMP